MSDASKVPVVEPLASQHNRSSFRSGNQELDRYLHERAGQDERRRVARVFVLVETSAPATVLGYYTLSTAQIDFSALPESRRTKLPRYPAIPAALLGRLAVDERYQGRGLGRLLLFDALNRVLDASRHLAVWAVVVDAIDDAAVRFYQKHDFLPLPDSPRRLFLEVALAARLTKGA